MRTILRTTVAAAAIAGLNLAGTSALAGPPEPGPFEELTVVELLGDEPLDDLTGDTCEPTEGPCGGGDEDDPVDPVVPDGPDEVTDDPCDPVESDCGDGDGGGDDDADGDPAPEPCVLDEVCTRTPTFTG